MHGPAGAGRQEGAGERRQTAPVRPRDPLLTGLVLVLYVLPLSAAVLALALSGLARLALALLAVELVIATAVVAARRTPRTRD